MIANSFYLQPFRFMLLIHHILKRLLNTNTIIIVLTVLPVLTVWSDIYRMLRTCNAHKSKRCSSTLIVDLLEDSG